WACAIVAACYVLIYLGALMYLPLLLGIHLVCCRLAAEAETPRVPWRVLGLTLAGLLVGCLLHPHRAGIPAFLRVQVLGAGLAQDSRGGMEWFSYRGELWKIV